MFDLIVGDTIIHIFKKFDDGTFLIELTKVYNSPIKIRTSSNWFKINKIEMPSRFPKLVRHDAIKELVKVCDENNINLYFIEDVSDNMKIIEFYLDLLKKNFKTLSNGVFYRLAKK